MTTLRAEDLVAGGSSEKDDVSVAPESGQPPGGPEDPWAEEDAGHAWPEPHHASPKDEL